MRTHTIRQPISRDRGRCRLSRLQFGINFRQMMRYAPTCHCVALARGFYEAVTVEYGNALPAGLYTRLNGRMPRLCHPHYGGDFAIEVGGKAAPI